MARFGYLFLRNGRWNDRQLISEKWIAMARTPGPANPGYGYCNWFLNTPKANADGTPGGRPFPSAPDTSVTFQGNGINVIYIDWDNDLLVVARWFDSSASLDQFLGRVIAAVAG
jgi:CubicO group peptidase (beta-lactamase class C family)